MAHFQKCAARLVRISQYHKQQLPCILSCWYSQMAQPEKQAEEFRVLELVKKSAQRTARRKSIKPILPPRTNVMPVDQDWTNVWPGPRSFHPASVPLPLRQGIRKKGVAPGKYANIELMKIPNFLHLTPPAIKKHCEALKKFCTPWPEELDKKQYFEHFPITINTFDFCFSSADIRNPQARLVVLQVKLSALKLDSHAKDKLLRLVGKRYNPKTDILILSTNRCPYKKQNYDYAMYLLTALYHESHKIEPWESEKTLVDMEYYEWEKNVSYKKVLSILKWPQPPTENETITLTPTVEEYKNAVTALMNDGESTYTIEKYKEATKKLLNLPEFPPVSHTKEN